jgi:mRNA interferase HigB
MRVIAHRTLVVFYQKYSNSKTAIEDWYKKVSYADWNCFAEIKKDFNSVDAVGNQHYVFNLKGNEYRLVVVIKFQIKMVYIWFIGTHDQYMQIDSKNI